MTECESCRLIRETLQAVDDGDVDVGIDLDNKLTDILRPSDSDHALDRTCELAWFGEEDMIDDMSSVNSHVRTDPVRLQSVIRMEDKSIYERDIPSTRDV